MIDNNDLMAPLTTPAARKVATEAAKVRKATTDRDKAIVAMSAEGASLREIGEVAELSHTAIAKILARENKVQDILAAANELDSELGEFGTGPLDNGAGMVS